MSTNPDIKQDIQTLNVGSPLVALYSIDLTIFGSTVAYFTAGPLGGASVYFNSIEYIPLPVETEGFEWEGSGKFPRPLVSVSNITLAFLADVVAYNDLIGAKFTRIRTFQKYLDGEPEADPTAVFPSDIFYVERKVKQNKQIIQWELAASVDLENVWVPKRQCIDICTHRYRWYDGGLQYENVTCPYTGSNYFDEEGVTTTIDKDKCARKLFDCQLRYPNTTDEIPGRFFPGIGKIGYPYR